ncbi:MAG: hypothetical protein A2W93_14450 [Bacteroidetes bacterium GWF2_43_63]|nr:MAG: hypothetical protein A2W94_01020 [Bacteroidetes bacterium GWE2_42_42]OFY52541.1 MAG: hypothetical protein A2W93_14450 [Bacteroidetes bacterium GWF2_43_63]HBG71449.1 hypothetical protein [Bacteroidales bacterium]HCB60799.1 hypothetical protein [Bacteroidales bacterium]HCY23476.1 hypothetical protein [Bacteroidales bacterium]
MILGFKTEILGEKTHFQEKILAGVDPELRKIYVPKIHTIRSGKRWKAGMSIQMATGVRTANYNQFNKDIPELGVCKSVQDIVVEYIDALPYIFVDGKPFNPVKRIDLFINDGFIGFKLNPVASFFRWFHSDFEGQIIHWTDFKYEL